MIRCWKEIEKIPDIKFYTPKKNQGQIVTISYGVDWEDHLIYCHWIDKSTFEEHWYYRSWKKSDGGCDFWNSPPKFPTRICGSSNML